MRMNDTVARIVDLMFENVEMNDEVAALRDEVMNNCQERYSDLIQSGVPEDDAIGAVVESLKGMEDVIAQYGRKARRATAQQAPRVDVPGKAAETETGEQHLTFAAGEVHKIDLTLISEDVRLEPSGDSDYHVCWNAEDAPMLQASLEGGTLRIDRRPGDGVRVQRDGRVEYHHKDAAQDFVRTGDGTLEIDFSGMDTMLRNLGMSLRGMFNNLRVSFGDAVVTIRIPHAAVPHVKLLTTSGDMDVHHVALAELDATSTSGDIDVRLDEEAYVELINLRTTSGDIEATAFAQGMTVSSTSGDVELEGRYNLLGVNTISGDIDVRADVKNMTFKAISGDVELTFESDEIREVRGSTISGDIDIDLPSGMGSMAINTHTRSGDVTTRCHTNGAGPTVTGDVSSLSGDITIR